MFGKAKVGVIAPVVGAILGPLVVLRDAIPSHETDWSGTWWITAGLTAAVVGSIMGALIGMIFEAATRRLH